MKWCEKATRALQRRVGVGLMTCCEKGGRVRVNEQKGGSYYPVTKGSGRVSVLYRRGRVSGT